jgi:NAD(P)-dependent dehydrogenase (short-subunit alcohol dehydrogenase family)
MKSCLLIGYGPGLGAALARAFGAEGYALGLISRSAENLARGERDLDGRGVRARGFVADAGDEHALQKALRHAESELGPPGVLLYNAAALRSGRPLGMSREDVVHDFRVNVAGALTAVQHVAPGMRARGQGTILLTGGGLSLKPLTGYASLSLGKAALRNLAHTLADELQPEGIHVATVTIAGFIKPGTSLAPDRLAAEFVDLHRQAPGAWDVERIIPPIS